MFKIGDNITATKLKKAYDEYAADVLTAKRLVRYVPGELSGKRRKPGTYEVLAELPTAEEYQKTKWRHYTCPASTAMSDAYEGINSLAEELRESHDNMPENFQNSDKGCRLEDAASTLESIEAAEPTDALDYIEVKFLPDLKASSRRQRLDDGADRLGATAEAIREWIDDNRPEDNPDIGEVKVKNELGEEKTIPVDWVQLEGLAEECERHVDEIEGVDI